MAWRRSREVSTPVTVTNPIRGSLSSGSDSDSTCRIDSFTRRMRSLIGIHDRPLHPQQLPFLTGEVALGAVEQLLELSVPARDAGDREPAALPQVVVVDLRDGGAETVLKLRLRGLHVLALALEGAGLREVQFDREDADITRAHHA